MAGRIDWNETKRCLECGSDAGRLIVKGTKGKETFIEVQLVEVDKRTGETEPLQKQGFAAYVCKKCGHTQFYGLVAK